MLYELALKSSLKYAKKNAFTFDNCSLTFEELIKCVNKLAVELKNQGIKHDDRVGILLYNSIEFVIYLLALNKIGSVVNLLNPYQGSVNVINLLDNVQLDCVIVDEYNLNKLCQANEEVYKRVNFIAKLKLADIMKINNQSLESICFDSEMKCENDRTVVVQCSSGTTGIAKMACRTNNNLLKDAISIVDTFKYEYNDVIYCSVPFCHGYGLTMGLIAPIKCGATVHIEKWFMPNRFIASYEHLHPSIFLGVPEIYEALNTFLFGKNKAFEHTRWFFSSSNPLTEQIGKNFNEITGIWLNQIYGMMEASTICANLYPNSDNFLSVGKPVKGVNIKIDDNEDSRGELLVFSEAVSKKYSMSSNGGLKFDEDGWFRTGDIARIDSKGDIYLVERK